jgi:hypothetical protein
MKGPSARARFAMWREWECPVCRRRERTGGHIVTRTCDCLAKNHPSQLAWMRLIEAPVPTYTRVRKLPGDPILGDAAAARLP